MQPRKIYVDTDDNAVFLCPECGKTRQACVKKFRNRKGALKVKCECSHVWAVELEFRTSYRKQTNLPGGFTRKQPLHGGRMVVRNLSMGGLGFDTTTQHFLKEGDVISIHFWLDDKHRSEIKKSAVVRVVSGNYVGAEFNAQSGQYDAALGFYLRT
ncbi:MAG: PilZ domain-containing protein [Desulfatibacillaceae bacterium]